MPDEEMQVDTVVEESGEDTLGTDFARVTLPEAKSPTAQTKPQSTSQESTSNAVDATKSVEKSDQSSLEAAKDGASEEVAEKKDEQAVVKKPLYKLKAENRIPQSRFNQVVRQRKIAEESIRSLQQEHLELLDFLERFQAANPTVALPKELITRVNEKKAQLQDARAKQHESRLDEAEEWLKGEMQQYVDGGFKFPSSLERELVAIVQAENLSNTDPMTAYQKAFKIWREENIDEAMAAEPTKTDASNASNQGDKQESGKSALDPKKAREEQKTKAAGIPKAKTSTSTSKDKDSKTNPYQTVMLNPDDDPRW